MNVITTIQLFWKRNVLLENVKGRFPIFILEQTTIYLYVCLFVFLPSYFFLFIYIQNM